MTRPNGVNTAYTYDNLSRLLSVLHQVGPATIDGASYSMDAAGNRTSKLNQLNGITENYAYNSIYQLTQVLQGGSTTESYTYDVVGNRLTSLGVPNYTYNNSNQLTSTTNATYTYDNNGNTLTKVDASGTTTYAWDFENRLASVTLPGSGGTVTFKYDPFGRRIQKSSASGTTNYVYDGANTAEEVDSSGSALARYAMGPGIDEPLAMLRGGVTSHYQADGLGSVTSLTDASGSLATTHTYDSFGKLVGSAGTVINPFRYTAREFDVEAGIYYYRARYYSSDNARLLSEDPIRFGAGTSFYTYVGNHPVNFSDPSGLNRQQIGPPTSQYNCLAWGLGLNWVWVQPADGYSPNSVFPHFGCKKIDCSQDVNCKARAKVKVFEDSKDAHNWHVERQTCDKGWTSKYGPAPLYDHIDDPDADYAEVYKPKGKVKVKCWSCPVAPPTTLPKSPDIQYIP